MADDTIDQAATTPEVTTPAEAPTEAPAAPESEAPVEQQQQPLGQEAEAPEAGADEEKPEGEADSETTDEPVDQKEQNRRGFAERQRARQALGQQLDQQFRAPTAEELMQENEGMDEREARIEAKFQELELKEQIGQIADLNTNLDLDARSIEDEMAVFNEASKDFDKDFAERVSNDYIRDAQVQFQQHVDSNGRPVFNEDGTPSLYVVSARVPMYDYYKSRYQDRLAGEKAGARRGQQAAEKMLASTDTIGTAHQADKSFDSMSLKEKEAYLRSKGHDI